MGRLLPGSQQWQEDSDSSRGTIVHTNMIVERQFLAIVLYFFILHWIYLCFCPFCCLKVIYTSENVINDFWLFFNEKELHKLFTNSGLFQLKDSSSNKWWNNFWNTNYNVINFCLIFKHKIFTTVLKTSVFMLWRQIHLYIIVR